MWHPLLYLDDSSLIWTFIVLAIGSVLLSVHLANGARRLRNPSAPLGLVSLSMSLSPEESCQIIQSWSEDRRDEARQHLVLDYWLIPAYTTALAILGVLAAQWFAEKNYDWLTAISLILAWAAWGMGLLDIAENSTLLRMLQMYPEIPDSITRLGSRLSRIKVLLLIMAIVTTMVTCLSRFA